MRFKFSRPNLVCQHGSCVEAPSYPRPSNWSTNEYRGTTMAFGGRWTQIQSIYRAYANSIPCDPDDFYFVVDNFESQMKIRWGISRLKSRNTMNDKLSTCEWRYIHTSIIKSLMKRLIFMNDYNVSTAIKRRSPFITLDVEPLWQLTMLYTVRVVYNLYHMISGDWLC